MLNSAYLSGSRSVVLADAAFGAMAHSGLISRSDSYEDSWLRAVACGGRGRYAAAHTELDALIANPSVPRRLVSLSLSTKASLLRQLGWHAASRGLDGSALAVAGGDVAARVDALIGLAADALGLGRFRLAETLLAQAAPSADISEEPWPWRLPLRLSWVHAELAMVSGAGEMSLQHARRAEKIALTVPSRRHQVKTAMVLAAALSSAGRWQDAEQVALQALADATALGLVPLRWALAGMLEGLSSGDVQAARDFTAVRLDCVAAIARAGGRWRDVATE